MAMLQLLRQHWAAIRTMNRLSLQSGVFKHGVDHIRDVIWSKRPMEKKPWVSIERSSPSVQ